MLFNSFNFLLFFPLVTALYFILPHRYRWAFLLLASIVFYSAFIPYYVFILFGLITIDYFAARYIEDALPKKKRFFLLISIFSLIVALIIFKYFNFFSVNLVALAKFLHWNYSLPTLNLILPIGLSFHTFQSLSYVIEVYRGNQRAEHHFGIYALYVMFYPQLVAGPIERPQNLLHQFYEVHRLDFKRMADGLTLMIWGFFKKIVIADRIATSVNQVFGHLSDYQGPAIAIAVLFFTFQIYCDFSGYSDIAIGAARVMGFKLMKNFNAPYLASSIGDFWKRWHISLSTWFRDYLYIPLGGNRVSHLRSSFNILFTFLISGLWHGANWTFVIWGFLHGSYAILQRFVNQFQLSTRVFGTRFALYLGPIIGALVTFLFVSFAWIFFRVSNVTDAFWAVRKIFSGWDNISLAAFSSGESPLHFFISLSSIIFLIITEYGQQFHNLYFRFLRQPLLIKSVIYSLLILTILVLGNFEGQEFIYFQF